MNRPSSYIIEISEDTRTFIVAALLAYQYPPCFEKADRDELDLLISSLQVLPEETEKVGPGLIHNLHL